jgi:hypothetical protein
MDLSVADEVVSWPTEEIPDVDNLWMRVHTHDIEGGEILPRAFRNHPKKTGGMSTDWAKYRTAQETRNTGRAGPENYTVIRLNVGEVRTIPDQKVSHTPDVANNNRAHTDVFGEKNAQTRVLLIRAAKFEINL